jgi:hypothetical protein
MSNPQRPVHAKTDWLVGLAVYGSALVGAISLLLGLVAVIGGRWDAAGTCFIAAAIAFGALANALFSA